MRMPLEKSRPPALRIWALVGARAGDNDQVIALAEALGIPFEVKHLDYGLLRLLGPRLLGKSLISLSRRSREAILHAPPPDLTISAGHRSVPAVQFLRHRSEGRLRSIHVGFPRVPPGKFDLVITTPQYPMADHPNLMRTPYALTRTAMREVDTADDPRLSAMPRPRSLLVVGGPNLYWRIDPSVLLGRLREILERAEVCGGSVLVTSSPRTPAALHQQIAAVLGAAKVPSILASPAAPPDYSSLLDAADSILVTADSVAMVSDAIWTGKPVALVEVTKTAFGRAAMALGDLLRPREPLYPQDLRYFWRALAEIGVTHKLARPQTSTDQEMKRVLARVRPILSGLSMSAK